MKRIAVEISRNVGSVRVINEQLWCCCEGDGIVVLDHSDLKQLRTIPAGDMGKVIDAADLPAGDVVIAASEGLFHADISGRILYERRT